MTRLVRILLLLAATLVPAWGQFALYLVNGTAELPVARTLDFGTVEPGAAQAVSFRIRNISSSVAILDFLQVNGSSFSIANANPAIPATLQPQKAVDFTVLFQSAGTGSYSASLDSIGSSVLLTANVPVELTCELETAAGLRALSAAPVDFGSVERGASAVRRVIFLNQTSAPLTVPGVQVAGAGFAAASASPSGTILAPGASAFLDLQFSPTADGAQGGSLTVAPRTYALSAIGVEPALPASHLSVSLAQVGSAQQGAISVNLDGASRGSGSGTVSLNFVPSPHAVSAPDSAIAFSSGGQAVTFTVSPGDTQGHFGTLLAEPFQTGTTAGTLTITLELTGSRDQQSFTILPAVVGITAAAGSRSTGSIEVDLTGFDNTRSAGALSFTFFDAAGNTIGPGAIQADDTSGFQAYFLNSAAGGFSLRALFPIAGDATQIKAFQAAVGNAAGSSSTARISF